MHCRVLVALRRALYAIAQNRRLTGSSPKARSMPRSAAGARAHLATKSKETSRAGEGAMPGADRDLFGNMVSDPAGRSPVGLRSWNEVISRDEEAELIARIDACALTPFRFQGWLGKRLTCSFGMFYDFENGQLAQVDPIPAWLLPVRTQLARGTGLLAECLVQALLIRYDPGAGIGWHRDRPVFDHVVGLSLGHRATLRFRKRTQRGFERYAHPAAPRSLYHLAGEARYAWEHSMAEMTKPRWSITFRTLAKS